MADAVTQAELDQARAVEGEGDQAKAGDDAVKTVELPESLKGWITPEDFNALPAKAQGALVEKAKSVDGNYTRKMQEVASLRRIQEDLEADPEKGEFLKKAMAEFEAQKAGVLPKPKAADAARSRLDAMLEGATAEQRESLRGLVDALDERYQTGSKEKDAKIVELERQVKAMLSDTTMTRREVLERELGTLPAGYKELGERYREQILRMGTTTGGRSFSVERLVQILSTPDEYRHALAKALPEQTKKEAERVRQGATTKPTGAVGDVAALVDDTMKTKSRAKGYGDTWDMRRVIGAMLPDIKRSMPSS